MKKDIEITMKAPLSNYLEPRADKVLIQAHLDRELVQKVTRLKNKHKLKTSSLLTGLFKFYLDHPELLKSK